ncbi:MAG TPA: hypothetical protein DD420_14260 [Streptomyces sp.]|nr:hypothetical protein [Streptomyces sp.]
MLTPLDGRTTRTTFHVVRVRHRAVSGHAACRITPWLSDDDVRTTGALVTILPAAVALLLPPPVAGSRREER